jgi:hypothetical protein
MRATRIPAPRRMLFLGVLVLAALMPVSALAAAPSATLTLYSYGLEDPPSSEFCHLQLNFDWTGFDADGNKFPSPLFKGQTSEAMGTGVYIGHTVELHADLRSKTGSVIAKTVTSLPNIVVNATCTL